MKVATLTHIAGSGQSGTTHCRTGFHALMRMLTGGFRSRHIGCIGFHVHVNRISGVYRTGLIVIHAPASMRNPPTRGMPCASVDQPMEKSQSTTASAATVHAANKRRRAGRCF